MMKPALLVILLCVTFMWTIAQAQSHGVADVIVTNGKMWTGDTNLPRAEAVAIIGERIVAVGTESDIRAWKGPGTKVVDAGGHLVVPGFNDAHVHFVSGGLQLDSVDLRDASTPQEFARRIGERAKITPKGEWITGGDWDETRWSPASLPTRQLIDALTADTPVFVNRYDGHESLANSAALKLAGIDAKTQSPSGGEIVRDAQGNPTGVLKDAAQGLVYKVIPNLTHDQLVRAVKRALAYAASVGVTSVQDMGPDIDTWIVYSNLASRGELTARIYAAPSIMAWEEQVKTGIRHGFGTSYLRTGAAKAFADGSLGSTTAYFFEPYTDAPNERGLLADQMVPLDSMRTRMMGSDAAGLQLCTHAIGDAAIAQVLDFYSDIEKAHGVADRRWRIEHSQHVAPKDFVRYANLGVIASVQPYHAIDDGRWAEKRIGPERIKTTYAFRTFLNNGVLLAIGTDWNVAPLDPMQTLYAAVTRATLDGKNPQGWVPEQKLTLEEALRAYTMGSAFAEFQENEKGSLTPGKLADMVVLGDDLFSIPPEKIKGVKVLKTIVGGRVVYEAK